MEARPIRTETIERGPVPLVDVLIPVRDRARFIAVCIDSVRAQTLQPNAVIIVDDGSTDDTPTILAEYAKRWSKLCVIRTEPRGVSHARNVGLAACQAPFVAFLDSDDIWRPDKLERQIALFAPDRPELGFVHCGCFHMDEFGQPLANIFIATPSKRGDIFQDLIEKSYFISGTTSAVMARRELVMALGGFDKTLFQGEDQDLWLKLAYVSHVDYVADALVGRRVHEGNSHVGIKADVPLFQELQVWNKWLAQIKNIDAVLEAFRSAVFSVAMRQDFRYPDLGLYYRLKGSDLHLARRLFPSLYRYLHYGLIDTLGSLKFGVVARSMGRSRFLLRLFRMFGEAGNISG
jgi:glycosyltransferase involved in cell wall biosynthesis